MSYNQVYEYELLDDVHNLFPEFLYDNIIFPSDANSIIGWVRYRMANLFPQTYRHQRGLYAQQRAATQRESFDDWMFLLNRSIVTPPRQIRMRDYGPPPATTTTWPAPLSPAIAALLTSPTAGWGSSAYTTPRRVPNQFIGSANLGAFLNTFFDDIPVNATPAEITAASTIMPHTTISQETICAVCQDHEPASPQGAPTDTAVVTWRKLNRCGHLFHSTCVDNWFARNAHCPVCRADIREAAAEDGMGV
jgi:hypothetical protein